MKKPSTFRWSAAIALWMALLQSVTAAVGPRDNGNNDYVRIGGTQRRPTQLDGFTFGPFGVSTAPKVEIIETWLRTINSATVRESGQGTRVRIFYNVHRASDPAGPFVLARPNSPDNGYTRNDEYYRDRCYCSGDAAGDSVYRHKSNVNIDLAAAAGNASGNYVFEYYVEYGYNTTPIVDGVPGTTTLQFYRFPQTGTYKAAYTLGELAAVPTISPNGGTFNLTHDVTLSTTTPDATIRYTLDGTDPTATSTVYTVPFTLTSTRTVKARTFKDGLITSATATAVITILDATTVQPPTVTPGGGDFALSQQIALATTTEGATIRYTTNNTEPTATSTLYTGPFTITATTTVRAKGFKDGFTTSPTTTATFTSRFVGLWGAKFRINGTNYEWYYNSADPNAADMRKVGPTGAVGGSPIRFGAEGHGSSDLATVGFNDGKLFYRINAVGQDTAQFRSANLTLSNAGTLVGNRQLNLDFNTSGIDLLQRVGNRAGEYVLDAYYTYQIYDRVNGVMTPPARTEGRYPSAGRVHKLLFTIRPVGPTFSPVAGIFDEPVQVTLTPGTEGATVRYTLDGSEPTASSTLYTAPFTVLSTTTVKAKSFGGGTPDSQTSTAVYQIEPYNPNVYPKFVVEGTLIKKKTSASDPGTVFKMQGININGTNWNWDFDNEVTDASMPTKVVDVWGFNAVRICNFLNSYQSNKRRWNATDDAKLKTLIDRYSAKGVVCMIEVHDNTGWYPSTSTDPSNPATQGCTLAELTEWWRQKAREYRNNPYVWFNIMNEPGFIDGTDYVGNTNNRNRWKQLNQTVIEALRSTQAENVIVVDAVSYASEAVGYGTVLDDERHRSNVVTAGMSSVMTDGATVRNFDPKANVVFAVHPYTGWDTPGKFKNYMDLVSGAGFPVIVGEAMPAFRFDGGVGWRAGWASRALWDILKYYRNGGHDRSAGWMMWHWNGAGGQKLVYGKGGKDANTNSFNTRPTNLSREGGWVWDQIHNPSALVDFIPVPETGPTRLEMERAMQWKDAWEESPNGQGTDDRFTGSSEAKAWTEWDINVQTAGTYKLKLFGFNRSGVDALFEFRAFDGALLGRATIPANTTNATTFTSSSFNLPAGEQIFRVVRLTAVNAQYSYVDLEMSPPDNTPPTVPTNLRTFSTTATTATIQWDAATDNEGIGNYEIFQNGTSVGKTTQLFLTLSGLTANTPYAYTIKALDYSSNASEASTALNLRTDPVQLTTNIDNKTIGTNDGQLSFSAIATSSAATNGWWEFSDAANFGGSEHYTTQANATITVNFTGTQAVIFGTKKSGHGSMLVSVDGQPEYAVPASFFTPGADARGVFVFATPKLSAGPHTLVLRNLGNYVAFDYAQISNGTADTTAPSAPAHLRAFYQTEKSLLLQWDAATDDVAVKEYEVFTGGTSLGKTAGTYLRYDWPAATGGQGTFTVKALDAAGNVSNASNALASNQPAAPAEIVNIDDQTEGTDLNQVQYSAKDPNGTATNGFYRYADGANFGGTETYTTQANATITIKFNGTQARVFGTKKSNHGTMTASIDGGAAYPIPVDFKTSGADQRGTFIWATPDLTPGEHTLVLRNNGQYIAFDRLVVVGAPDVTPPVAKAKNVTLELNEQGQGTLTADAVDDGSIDNRAIAGRSLSKTSFDCANVGPNVVVLTVTDEAGNSATDTATVTVTHTVPKPILTADPTNRTVYQGTRAVTLTVTNATGTVEWTGGTGSGEQNRQLVLANGTPAGTYTLSALNQRNGCRSDSATVQVTVLAPVLSVLHQDGDNGQTGNNHIKPNLQLRNESGAAVPYGDITVRYWLTVEQFAAVNGYVDWAQLGTGHVQMQYVGLSEPRAGATGYVEYRFAAAAGSLAAGAKSGPIQTRIAKTNWTNFNETDDYSFGIRTAYTKTDRITIYRNGTLVWGVEPAPAAPVQAVKVWFENKNRNATTNQLSATLQVSNEGNVPVRYRDLAVRYWFTAEGTQPLNFWVDYAALGNARVRGAFVRPTPALPGADAYLEVQFDSTLGALHPLSSTGDIRYRVAKANWSNFTETDDHSYRSFGPLGEHATVTVYYRGQLIYGLEPGTPTRRAAAVFGASAEAPTWRVAPSPAEHQITLHGGAVGEAVEVRIYNAAGQMLRQEATHFGQPVSVRTLGTGLYLLRAESTGRVQVLKFMKQ
jgi:hypothetical protein